MKITDAKTSISSSESCALPDVSVCSTSSDDSVCLEASSRGGGDESSSDVDEAELGDFLRDALEGFDAALGEPFDFCA